MMYSYPFGHINPYGYYGYNKYGYRGFSPTDTCIHKKSLNNYNYNSNCNCKNALYEKMADMPKQSQKKSHVQNLSKHENISVDKPIFDFFGIRLFSDDLLLLAILYFLYSEGVNDPELFIALLLLLIS